MSLLRDVAQYDQYCTQKLQGKTEFVTETGRPNNRKQILWFSSVTND